MSVSLKIFFINSSVSNYCALHASLGYLVLFLVNICHTRLQPLLYFLVLNKVLKTFKTSQKQTHANRFTMNKLFVHKSIT